MAAAAAELGPEVEQLHRAEEARPGDEEEEHSLERLEMLRVIGTGTFARVCLARARGSNKHYALKILTMATVIKLKQVRKAPNVEQSGFKTSYARLSYQFR